jgi:hypothetical protein
MSPLGLARFNTAAIIIAAGLVVGHWMQPVPGVVLWRRTIPFLALIGLLGALRGWREAALRQPPAGRSVRVALIVAFAVGSMLLVGVGYVAFHGPPA